MAERLYHGRQEKNCQTQCFDFFLAELEGSLSIITHKISSTDRFWSTIIMKMIVDKQHNYLEAGRKIIGLLVVSRTVARQEKNCQISMFEYF